MTAPKISPRPAQNFTRVGCLVNGIAHLHTTPESHLYFYSQIGLSKALGIDEKALRTFLESETGKALLGKLQTPRTFSKNQGEISHIVEGTVVGQSFKIKGISCELAQLVKFNRNVLCSVITTLQL